MVGRSMFATAATMRSPAAPEGADGRETRRVAEAHSGTAAAAEARIHSRFSLFCVGPRLAIIPACTFVCFSPAFWDS